MDKFMLKFKVNIFQCITSISLIVVISNCSYDKASPAPIAQNCDVENVTFSKNVQPILSKNCYACHSTNKALNNGGGIDLENFEELKTYTEPLIRSVKRDDLQNYKAMPPSGKLNNCDIAAIEEWIKKGALK